MELISESHNAPERDVVYRMRCFDIAADSPASTWGRSAGAGATFEELWRLDYRRACAGRTP